MSFQIRTDKKNTTEKYQKIIDAAIKVFAKKGFYNSKVSDVAEEASVADGTIYLYFKNKDDLLISIFEHSMDFFFQQAKSHLNRVESPAEKLKKFIALHLALVQKNQNLATVIQIELRSSHKFMIEYRPEKFLQYLQLLEKIILEGQEKNLFKKTVDLEIATRIIFGAIDELALVWILMKKKRYQLDQAAEQLFQLVHDGIKT